MKLFNKKNILIVLLVFLVFFSQVGLALAAGDLDSIIDKQKQSLAQTGLPGEANPLTMIILVIRGLLGTLALLFLVIIIIAGFRWMTSDGNSETIDKAKKSIQAAFVGLAVIAFSYAITALVFNVILKVD